MQCIPNYGEIGSNRASFIKKNKRWRGFIFRKILHLISRESVVLWEMQNIIKERRLFILLKALGRWRDFLMWVLLLLLIKSLFIQFNSSLCIPDPICPTLAWSHLEILKTSNSRTRPDQARLSKIFKSVSDITFKVLRMAYSSLHNAFLLATTGKYYFLYLSSEIFLLGRVRSEAFLWPVKLELIKIFLPSHPHLTPPGTSPTFS